MIDKLKFIYFYIKGKSLLLDNNISEALLYFIKAAKYNKNDYDLYAYKGLCEFLLKKFDNAIISYQHALCLINKKKYNADEEAYLKYYVLENLIKSLNFLEKTENLMKYRNLYNNLKFNRKNIREQILRNFPV